MTDPFVHLQVASSFSMGYGVSRPDSLVRAAAAAEMDTLALTDRDGVYGAIRFAKACEAAGVRPVLGADLAFRVEARARGEFRRGLRGHPRVRQAPVRGGLPVDPRHPRVTVLAQGRGGWAALCRLVSATHLAGERGQPVTTPELISRHADGGRLVILLGPDSDVGRALAARRFDQARHLLDAWREVISPRDLVIAVVSHAAAIGHPASTVNAARALGLAREAGLSAVLTNAVRYADRWDAQVADVLDATRRLVPLDIRHVDRANSEGYLKTGKEMADVAAEVVHGAGVGSVVELLAGTRAMAERCVLDPRADLGLGEIHFPELDGGAGRDAMADLRGLCAAGLVRRYGAAPGPAVLDRLDEELDVIGRLGYPSYFLTVGEVCDLIREMGIRVAARGSGAGSLVCYLLGISGVDPIRYGLLMERFLSPLRTALPDVDIDVESARREEVYHRIFSRFGSSRVACVSMMDTYRVRHAIRDAGAALGMPRGEIDAIAKAFPHIRARDVRLALTELPELRSSGLSHANLDLLFSLVERLDGLPRHIALHPCGVLLSDLTLLDRTAIESSAAGFPMSQFDKDDVEDIGLLKLDVLGIRMQSAMAHAVDEVVRVEQRLVDLDDRGSVPLDDSATFELIRSTRTLGCFQIESPGQRELIGKFGPQNFDDLVIDISLFRPGPVKSDMVTPFLMARQGWRDPAYLHPDLEPVLRQTNGVVVFHEQVIDMVAVLTGCTRAEADQVRRALGAGDGSGGGADSPEVREWFVPRARARGYEVDVVERAWAVLVAFASFGFCKAHAAAFALPTYQSAWLKAHHPAAFFAGVLTHDPGMYPKRLILDDARHFGVTVLPVDVNASDDVYRVVDLEGEPREYAIRVPLGEVRGISAAEVARVLAARPYVSLADFWNRARVSRPVVERLVLTGAFDSLYGWEGPQRSRKSGMLTRRDLLLQVGDLDRWHGTMTGQLLLDLAAPAANVRGSGLPELTVAERVQTELDVLGMDVTHHVVHFYERFLDDIGVVRSRDLLGVRSEAEVLVAGVKVATQTPPVRSGRRVVFLTLDDATGPVDATFFDDTQDPFAATLFSSWLLLVRGHVRRTGARGVSVRATGCWNLPDLEARWRREGRDSVRAVLSGQHGGEPPGRSGHGEWSGSTKLWYSSPGSSGR